MSKAVIYARFSSSNQSERSIEGQLEDCMSYADRNGITVLSTYIDRARSGTEAEHRPQFQKLIADSVRGAFDTVLVWKMDRFSRSRYDFAIYKSKLKQNGVTVLSINEPSNNDPTSIILDGLIEAMAEYYSVNLSQNVKRGLRVARSHGLYTGGRPTYGYDVVDRHLVVNEDEATIIREVFERYARCETLKSIVADLNKRGLRSRDGNPFTVNSFQHCLRNHRYIGEYVQAGDRMPEDIPQIIDTETFELVQKQLEHMKRAPGSAGATVPYLLQGKAYCGLCGAPLVGESGRGRRGGNYHYYACSCKKKTHACSKKNERKESLEEDVIRQTIDHLRNPSTLDNIAHALEEAFMRDPSQVRISELNEQIKTLNDSIDRTLDIITSGSIGGVTVKLLSDKIEGMTHERDALNDELLGLTVLQKQEFSFEDCKKLILDITDGDPADMEFSKGVVSFINSVYVYDDRFLIFYSTDPNEPRVTIENAREAVEASGSDFTSISQPKHVMSELIVICQTLFGLLLTKTKR